MVLSIIFLVLFLVLGGASIYFTSKLVKTAMIEVDYKKFFYKNAILVGGSIISFLVASFGFYMWLKATPDFAHVIQLIIGALLMSGGLLVAINCFILHYYGKNIPEKLDKWLFRVIIIGFVTAAVFFYIWTNGLAPYLTYPLVNGISFTQGFVTPAHGSPNIAFYALCILGGAILVYFFADHFMYKEYGEHGILESTFFVAFPAGIIGARIAFVIGEWSTKFDNGRAMTEAFGTKIWAPLAIWEGGITILGGAIGGILVGALWYMWRNKGKSIWVVFDIAVPLILIAQAIGRWGNFFNCEVHGVLDSVDNWKWLPEIIWRNAQYSSVAGAAPEGTMYVPLFFIEAVVNLLGYFVLAHVFGKKLRKFTEFGDLGFGYIIWYGLTRVFMEPLRYADFNMGEKGYWSWIWSMIFVGAGTLLIVANHIIRNILRKKNNTFSVKPYDKKLGLISSAAIVVVSAILITLAIINMSGSKFEPVMGYNQFNVGLMLLVVGASFALCLGISLPILFDALNNGKQHETI